ncbi:MAG: ABC transporter permease [Alphaproteobacteria bacterium]|nr:ABC transporter permease [Alphaproteobacteria bacterium]
MSEPQKAAYYDFSAIPPLPVSEKTKPWMLFHDIADALKNYDTWLYMAWSDIKLRYQRTVLGPFWMVLVSFISIICIAGLGSLLFKVRFSDFFPYVASGMVIWQFISLLITESGMVFLQHLGIIKNVNVSLVSFCMRLFVKNVIILAHSLVVVSLILIAYHVHVSWSLLLVVPGLLVASFTSVALSIIFGFMCARFRDLLLLLQAIIGILAFMTPVMWQPDMLGSKAYLAYFNPLTHYIDILRMPLLGQTPPMMSYAVTLSMSGLLLIIAAWVYQIYRKRLVYWL